MSLGRDVGVDVDVTDPRLDLLDNFTVYAVLPCSVLHSQTWILLVLGVQRLPP